MRIGKVVGSTVSTVKHKALVGAKLLIVEPTDADGVAMGPPLVAVDAIGAGVGETVLVVTGGAARAASPTADAPVDALIVAIVDSLEG